VAGAVTTAPALPQRQVDVHYARPKGRKIHVGAGGNLQKALDDAKPSDVIVLDAGATFVGPFVLPEKPGNDWIYIESSRADDLPPPGHRVTPANAPLMPKILASERLMMKRAAIETAAGAHHYRLVGIELAPEPGTYTYNVVQLGWTETDPARLPHDIIVDRCYVHGDPVKGSRRGVALNGNSMALVDSHVSDFKEVGADSQAVFGFNGYGPIKIANNYLEAAGENLLFGGATPRIANLIPADIEIRQNHFFKPYTWKQDDPSYLGVDWNVKNLLELKMGRRVLIDGNLFERSWPAAQQGWAVLFTPRTEDGAAPWVVVEDVTFSNNWLRDVALGFDISGVDGSDPTPRTARIAIRNNLFEGMNGSKHGPGNLIVIPAGVSDLSFEHNTVLNNGAIISVEGAPSTRFVFQNNILPHNEYGVTSPKGIGDRALAAYFPQAVFRKNAIVGPWPSKGGASPSMYSGQKDNFFPASTDAVGFLDRANRNYKLSDSSAYKNAATDGGDLGVNVEALATAARAGGSP
jgi:hypothetical protein